MCTPCFIYTTMSPRLFYKHLGGIFNDHKKYELMHVCICNINTNQLLCKPQKLAQILHFSKIILFAFLYLVVARSVFVM